MTDQRQMRELAEAVAYLSGDFRDEPQRCAACGSPSLAYEPAMQLMHCDACRATTTKERAVRQQRERMRARVLDGVGGPAVVAAEKAARP